MKVRITKSFRDKLKRQVDFIAQDKPDAARKFKNDLLSRIKDLGEMPYKCKQSVFFESEEIRDFVFKGYRIVYRINEPAQAIEVFGFVKWQDDN